jgi:hypothetical protein
VRHVQGRCKQVCSRPKEVHGDSVRGFEVRPGRAAASRASRGPGAARAGCSYGSGGGRLRAGRGLRRLKTGVGERVLRPRCHEAGVRNLVRACRWL